ncbi:hypothetical protein FRZ03_16855 [Streptomyces misionensis]|uniref:Uncharacterized protein n=1 Tax=Streptomyces misionensis TaxID=67331 RepID=A0A5C6JSF2_9ACTN|nr:hypothetical protein FRZ03_16855 [Streptomyces misionensis]
MGADAVQVRAGELRAAVQGEAQRRAAARGGRGRRVGLRRGGGGVRRTHRHPRGGRRRGRLGRRSGQHRGGDRGHDSRPSPNSLAPAYLVHHAVPPLSVWVLHWSVGAPRRDALPRHHGRSANKRTFT